MGASAYFSENMTRRDVKVVLSTPIEHSVIIVAALLELSTWAQSKSIGMKSFLIHEDSHLSTVVRWSCCYPLLWCYPIARIPNSIAAGKLGGG